MEDNKLLVLKKYKEEFNKNKEVDDEEEEEDEIIFKKRNIKELKNIDEYDLNNNNKKNKRLIKNIEFVKKIKEQGCCICFTEYIESEAKTNGCDHYFCMDCIKEWSDVNNFCPICKIKFTKIIKINEDGIDYNYSINYNSDKSVEESVNSLQELINKANDYCYSCRFMTEYNFMMICDNCNQKCCHMKCLKPPIKFIPLDRWFCDFCRRDENLTCQSPDADIFNKNNKERQEMLSKIAIRKTEHFKKKINKKKI